MNNLNLIDKLRTKINDSEELINYTQTKQINLINTTKEVNRNLMECIETNINNRNILVDGEEKLSSAKIRIDTCKKQILLLKDKLKQIQKQIK